MEQRSVESADAARHHHQTAQQNGAGNWREQRGYGKDRHCEEQAGSRGGEGPLHGSIGDITYQDGSDRSDHIAYGQPAAHALASETPLGDDEAGDPLNQRVRSGNPNHHAYRYQPE